jgi:hypothetical protein
MAAPIVLPFNFSPSASPSVKTTSYTVPTGKYAQVKCYFEGIETQTANTTTVLNSRTITLNGVTVLVPYAQGCFGNSGSIGTFTITLNRPGFILLNAGSNINNGGSFAIGPLSILTTSGGVTYSLSGVSTTFTFTVGLAGDIRYLASIRYETPQESTFWAKAGDVITGTGNWRALVTEYNAIS